MNKRVTIDPVTRIEGHLRVDVEVDGGRVKKAWASGQMWRGVENILIGRDPRDAWAITQRICGVCTTVHAIASVRAVENALQLEIPVNAQYIRNMIILAHAVHDHIVHFYHLSALDWVDVVSALKADPAKTASLAESLSNWSGNSKAEFVKVQERLKGFVGTGQLGIFTNGYWGHPAMKLTPEVNLLAVSHYLQALEIQRFASKIVAVLGSEVAAHPERRSRRRGQPAVGRFAVGADHRAAAGDQGVDAQAGRLRQERLSGGRRRHRRFLCRLDQVWSRHHRLPVRAGHPARRQG
jgi:hydrogenase large subunit